MSSQPWTPFETDALINLVIEKRNDWRAIAAVLNRTPLQCRNKYRYLQFSAPWSDEDEMKIKTLMSDPNLPNKNISKWLSKQMGTKSPTECWYKIQNYSSLKRNKWTFEEKVALISGESNLLTRSKNAIRRQKRRMYLTNDDPCKSDKFKIDDRAYDLIMPDQSIDEFVQRYERRETIPQIVDNMNLPIKMVRHYYFKVSHKFSIPSEECLRYFLELYKTQGPNFAYIANKLNEQYSSNDFNYAWCYRTFNYLCI